MRLTAREKEWNRMIRSEKEFLMKGASKKDTMLNQLLAEKVPDKLQGTLDAAFAKAFETIFQKGTGIIEKTYKKEELEHQYQVNAFAADLKENKKTLRKFSKQAGSASTKNLLLTSVEGIGMGAFGVGLPDIPVFVGVLLKSVYEVALSYGYKYDTPEEQYFILKLIETSLSHGQPLVQGNVALNQYIESPALPENYNLSAQIASTSATMSKELLYLKFLQGFPVVGAVGGAYNTVYLQQVLKYAKLKYQRRFLYDKANNGWTPDDAC
ncbi:MAG: EcsC family protein [Firmicutes bacterium]|nr:EcsC family protein [Bacillota bacterium]